MVLSFSFTATAPTEIYTLSLHDALPIWAVFALERVLALQPDNHLARAEIARAYLALGERDAARREFERSEEHTSELQSLRHLVCRLLLEKKKKKNKIIYVSQTAYVDIEL